MAKSRAIDPRRIARKNLDAIFVLIESVAPRPLELLARVQEYVNARAEEEAETVQAQWVNEWLRRRQEWLARLGKLLTAAEVAAFSPSMKTSSAVHKARHEGRLIAFDLGDRTYFPEFQFEKNGKPAPWVRPLVEKLRSPDTLLQFLAARRTAHKGRSFAEILREAPVTPATVETMLQAATEQADAEAR